MLKDASSLLSLLSQSLNRALACAGFSLAASGHKLSVSLLNWSSLPGGTCANARMLDMLIPMTLFDVAADGAEIALFWRFVWRIFIRSSSCAVTLPVAALSSNCSKRRRLGSACSGEGVGQLTRLRPLVYFSGCWRSNLLTDFCSHAAGPTGLVFDLLDLGGVGLVMVPKNDTSSSSSLNGGVGRVRGGVQVPS